MEKTKKAKEQIRKLREEIKDLKAARDRISKSNYPYDYKSKEMRRLSDKSLKKEEKIDEIGSVGLSSGEIGSLKRALGDYSSNFKTVKSEKDIGSTTYIKVGYFKPLKQYVKVKYHKFSGLMRNVRGMASLAGQIDIVNVTPITESQYNKIIGGKGVTIASFMGATQVKKFKI